MRKISAIIVAAGLAATTPAAAAEWQCSNQDLAEIRCGRDSCEIERESYTPMALTIAPAKVEICAYSGCFLGRVSIRRTAGPHVLYHATVRTGDRNERIAIILDTEGRTALMRWMGFSNVMRCEAGR